MNQNNILISGIHIHVHDGYKHHIDNKTQKLIKHQSKIDFFQFELEKDLHSKSHSKEYIAKGRMQIEGKFTYLFSAKSDNMYQSIDLLIGKLDRSLRKKSRLKKFKRKILSCLNKVL